MIVNKEEYEKIQNEVLKYSKEYQNENRLNAFRSHIQEKMNNFKPTIMVYGTYNSGKSTLINALFGRDELAKTGDAPETSKVSAYEYNGYTLYDTPGINAPQEHETVTNKQLKKCELVLFVLSNDGSFEEKYIYEKISEIVELKKPILIVLNNKAGIEKDSIEELEQFDKVNYNLNKIGDANGIESIETKVNISMVNAKTALKAKLKNKKLLLTNSNISQLENEIDRLLEKSGNSEVVNALNIFISDYINDTLSVIDAKIDNPEMKKTQETITYLEKLKQKTYIELQNILSQSIDILKNRLMELLLARDEKGIQNFVQNSTKEIQQSINKKIQDIEKEIQIRVEDFNTSFQEVSLSSPQTSFSLAEEEDASIDQEEKKDDNSNIITLQAGTVFIPPTIPVGPIPIPARLLAQMAIALYAMFQGSNEEQKNAQAKVDAQRDFQLSVKNKANEFGYEYKIKLNNTIDDSIKAIFESLVKKFVNLSQKLQNDNQRLLEDKSRLTQILNKI